MMLPPLNSSGAWNLQVSRSTSRKSSVRRPRRPGASPRSISRPIFHSQSRERYPIVLQRPSSSRAVRSTTLDYGEDGSVSASVKLQELFGLAQSPTVGMAQVPVTFHLLAPNGRPVQTTKDLRSFWERTYPEVRKELRGRYPRHPWPEDPWTAQPTHRTTRRR